MRRTFLVPATLALTVLAGCGGYTDAEQRFLDDMQEATASVELKDPAGTLDKGHAVCDELADTKPERRLEIRYLMQQPSVYGYGVVHAAMDHLCPDLKA